MHAKSHVAIGVLFVALMAVGGVQGGRIDRIQDSELFYRWALNAALDKRVTADASGKLEGEPTGKDDDIFNELAAVGERSLPNYAVDENEDYDPEGKVYPRLVRAARLKDDAAIWRFCNGPDAAPVRQKFFDYARAGQITGWADPTGTLQIYNLENPTYGAGVTSLFLGFRKVAATFLWLQVDKFWHMGQMHRMVPAMQTCVTLDPTFVEAYLLGGWHLAYNIPAKLPVTPEPQKEFYPRWGKRLGVREYWYYTAVDFLKDGIRNNPRDYRLYFDLGYSVFENKLSDHPNAIRYLKAAREHRHDKWVPRMLFLAQLRNGDHEDAIKGWEEYTRIFPDNMQAERFVPINRAFLAEAKAQDAKDCAEAAQAAAERLRQQAADTAGEDTRSRFLAQAAQAEADAARFTEMAEEFQREAIGHWSHLETSYEDPMAKARLLRLKALDEAAKGRELEAITHLDEARWLSPEFFDEASNRIIEIKQKAGIPLTVSETVAVQREREAAPYRDKPETTRKRRIPCEYLDVEGQLTQVVNP